MTFFEGNISGTDTSPQYALPMSVKNFSLVNKSGSVITVNVSIIGGAEINIVPYDLQLMAGDMARDNEADFVIPANSQIKVSSTGLLSYYFTLENLPQ